MIKSILKGFCKFRGKHSWKVINLKNSKRLITAYSITYKIKNTMIKYLKEKFPETILKHKVCKICGKHMNEISDFDTLLDIAILKKELGEPPNENNIKIP